MVVDIEEVKRHIKPKADSTLRNMRKNDLIEYIRSLEHNYNVAVSFNENQAKYIESLGLMIGWIPVTERLPKEGDANEFGDVMVWLRSVRTNSLWRWTMVTDHPDAVTHWMPLPSAPKEEDDVN